MRVLIINETSALGGAETMAVELANALSAIPGIETGFVSGPGALSDRLASKVRRHTIDRYRAAALPAVVWQLAAILRAFRPHVVHPQGATIGALASLAARLASPATRIVITHHSRGFTRVPSWLGNALLGVSAHRLIAISKAKHASLVADGFHPGKVHLIPNFVDRSRMLAAADDAAVDAVKHELGIQPRDRIVVSSGRLIPRKRFDIFVKTLEACARADGRLRLVGVVLGDGPERTALQAASDGLGLPNLRIHFTGFRNNVTPYLRLANVFLFPSEWREVLPMCLIEALAMGLPVVCSKIPGNDDIVDDGVNGFLVDVKSGDYALPVTRLLTDPGLASAFSAQSVEKAERCYEKHVVVASILDVYRSVVQQSRAAP